MNYEQCERCVMDTTDPNITFEEGVCNHCQAYRRNERTRLADKKNLPQVLKKLRSGKVLMGLSGGLDSSLALHYLIENGIDVVAFTVDNGWNEPLADKNVENLVKRLNIELIKISIKKPEYVELQSAFIQSGTANIEIPTDHVLAAITYQLASSMGIKNIVSGGNHATENVMPTAWGHGAYDLVFIKDIYRRFIGKRLKNLPVMGLLKYNYYKWIRGINITYILDYYEYNQKEAIELLHEKYDWESYGDKHEESAWTKWFQNYFLYEKFGFDKRKAHYSSLINSGQMTKREAMDKLISSPVYPKLGIEAVVMKYPKKSYKDYRNSEWLFNLISKIVRTLR